MDHSLTPCTAKDAAVSDTAEAYVLQRMSARESERYEEHLLVCPRCQDAVREFDVFLTAARISLADSPHGHRHRRLRAKSASG
jgi:hypothetical protein